MEATYYVYDLIDPRTGAPFYVGKGCGSRVEAHEREAAEGSAHPKCEVIRGIWDAGLQVERRIVAWFASEQAAYDFEEGRIAEIGLSSLTNLTKGGGAPRSGFGTITLHGREVPPDKALERLMASSSVWGQEGHALKWLGEWLLSNVVAELGAEALIESAERHGVEVKFDDQE